MNTEEFLRHILPEAGLKVLAELIPVPNSTRAGWRYTKFTDFSEMAAAALQMDAQGRTVYHACSSFGDWYFDTKKNKRRLRTQANVVACRSLYDDIDVGKPDTYTTRKEAGAALKSFIKATGLPLPTIVYSGGGVHLYWTLTEDISSDLWQRLADKKRLVTQHFGLKIDTACDTDTARVLRPVGTTWRKTEDREVTCKNVGTSTTPEALEAVLDAYINDNRVATRATTNDVPDWMKAEKGNLADQVTEFPPAYIETVAEFCAQIQAFRESGGEAEPVWHAIAGVAKFCVDGPAKYHEWSAKYEGYTEEETQGKIDMWGAKPTTCDEFKKRNSAGCKGCKRTCKSPIGLGLRMEDITPKELTVVVDTVCGSKTEKRDLPELFPRTGFDFDWKTERITGGKRNADGDVVVVPVASPLFYITDSIQMEDGTSALVIERVIRGRSSQFELPTKYTADARSLKVQLAAYRITTMDDKLMQSFVQLQMEANRQKTEEINTYAQLGWHHDGSAFLIGSKLITCDGTNPVRVGKAINSDLSVVGTKKGDAQTWVAGVNELYNRPNAEPYQLAICLAFGGIFGPLMPSAQWKGIPFALTSDTSGIGKSTACKVGLNIYCPADATMVVDSTAKGMLGRTSAMGSLPFLMDEVTKYVVEPKDMSDLLYALSNGHTRIGLNGDGTERTRLPGWNVPVMLTGNRNIMHHVTEHNLTPEAAQMRVFEIDIETYPLLPTFDKTSPEYAEVGATHQAITNDLIANHYGVIGEDWIRWVIAHRTEIKEKLAAVGLKLRADMHGGNASKERFYYDLAAMMLVGGYFAKKLGYLQFDLNNLKSWIVRHVAKLRSTTEENKSTPEDLFAHLMSDLNGKLLVTNRFDGSDRRSATTVEMDQGGVRGAVEGRVIMGTDEERPRIYVSIRAVTQWCAKNGVQYTKFKRDLMALNLIRLGTPGCNPTSACVRVNIGKGVVAHEHLGRVNCLEFDAAAAKKHLSNPAPVVPIREGAEMETCAA